MSNDIAIRVEKLSKAYRIGVMEQRHRTLVAAANALIKSPLKNFRNLRKLTRFDDVKTKKGDGEAEAGNGQPANCESQSDVIWALKDVSFEVKHGEMFGIIGRNGAGKSTLLKILARITPPTSGRATIYGRVGSLLEVGTGFHLDLTGRENIYLNGTILGMSKNDVDRKFDEIVDFSEVEKFIDTPVKRYSTGMRMRLAFSVAAHLEPEILIVDEVLAVGDVSFQAKCMGKMHNVARQGRTVLFVSHNTSAVAELCQKGLVLAGGKLSFQGSATDCIRAYTDFMMTTEAAQTPSSNRNGISNFLVNGSIRAEIKSSSPFQTSFTIHKSLPKGSWLYLILEDSGGRMVFHVRLSTADNELFRGKGPWRLAASVPSLWLAPGPYSIHVKALLNQTVESNSRFISERLPVDFSGQLDNTGKALLTPEVAWTCETQP